MTTPGWKKTILEDIIRDPPGTWRKPSDAVNMSTLMATVTRPHRPVVHVVAVTPVDVGAGDWAKAEAWYLPVVGGEVSWDAGAYPQGTARIEVGGDLNHWKPGPPPAAPHAVDPAPDTPTLSTEGVPWAVLPFGTIVSVYHGWRDEDGTESGFRVFDGLVVGSEYDRPGRTWRLDCADFSIMAQRVSWRRNLTIAELIVGADGPSVDPLTADEYVSSTAITAVLREAAEFWWPLPNTQLEWNEPSIYDVRGMGGVLADPGRVPVTEIVGERDGWSLIEQWCDTSGRELYMLPGERGACTWSQPVTIDTTTPDSSVTLVARGDSGTLVGYRTAYTPRVNRLYYSLYAQAPDEPYNAGTDGTAKATNTNGTRLSVRMSGMTAELEVAQTKYETLLGTTQDARVWWDHTAESGTADLILDSPKNPDGGGGAAYKRGPMVASHDYQFPGTYTIRVLVQGENFYIPVTARPNNEIAQAGFANRFVIDHPLGVRRSGRVSWIGGKEWSTKRMKGGVDPDDVDDLAEKMFTRVAGASRTNTLEVVPMPWVMPRTTIRVDIGDGIKTERHLVESVRLPLTPGDTMTLTTSNSGIGTPAAGTPRVKLTNTGQTDTGPGADVTATATVKNADSFDLAWGDGTRTTYSNPTPGTSPWTLGLAHTYTADGTFKVTAWVDIGIFDRIQYEVPSG